jgi:hypothetical protein
VKTFLIIIGALLALTALAVATGPPPSNLIPTDNPYEVVTDLNQAQMLDIHQPMMDQMRGKLHATNDGSHAARPHVAGCSTRPWST